MIRQRALAHQKVSVHQSVLAGAGSFVFMIASIACDFRNYSWRLSSC
ncbi:MAG: hypothetical protein V5B38_18065 [Candidatus Accumulibacter propinquus]